MHSSNSSSEPPNQDPASLSKDELNQQTATVEWEELIKHFARGVVIYVGDDMDLVDVAHQISKDNVSFIESCLAKGNIRRATDDDARDWYARSPVFWCVVAAPWVLIQECNDNQIESNND